MGGSTTDAFANFQQSPNFQHSRLHLIPVFLYFVISSKGNGKCRTSFFDVVSKLVCAAEAN